MTCSQLKKRTTSLQSIRPCSEKHLFIITKQSIQESLTDTHEHGTRVIAECSELETEQLKRGTKAGDK